MEAVVNESVQKNIKQNEKSNQNIRCIGVNAAGLMSKLESFDFILYSLKPSIFSVQETKVYRPGKIKTDHSKNYTIYELHRKKTLGGGIALGVLNSLDPLWIDEGDDDSEYIVVGITIGQLKARIISAYGVQESAPVERKAKFWSDIDHQVKQADFNREGVILQMDGNFWAGPGLIRSDPNPQNRNGEIFEEFMKNNPSLYLINGTDLCDGDITRERITEKRNERSILDFFLVCEKLKPFVTKMKIDNQREYPLTTKANKMSDHFTTYLDLSLSFTQKQDPRKDLFNFRNIDCQEAFKNLTEKTKILSKCFESQGNFHSQCKKWRKNLDHIICKSFKKIRVNNKIKVSEENKLLADRLELINEMKKNNNVDREIIQKKLDEVERILTELTSKKNRDKIINNFQHLDGSQGDSLTAGVWQIKKKIFPKHQPPLPAAMQDINGRLVRSKQEIKKLYRETFAFRLRDRPVREGYEEIEKLTKELCYRRLDLTKHIKSPRWEMKDLEKALGKLKNNKARDPAGLINEIFKPDVAGEDLKNSLLIMFNTMKENTFLPDFVREKTITTIFKQRGSRLDLENHRAVFIGSIFNSILMKLIYNDKYRVIDENMSCSQVGARKNKNIRDHNWMINNIVLEAVRKNIQAEIIVSDYKQAFDTLNTESVLTDLYDSGVKDNELNLIYEADSTHFVKVNSPVGLTGETTIKNKILQGCTLGPVKCSNSVDKIGKQCLEQKQNLYLYRSDSERPVEIPPLGMVDDIITVSRCGKDTVKMCSYLNTQTNIKKLQFGTNKCHKMHIGKDRSICPDLFIDKWKLQTKNEVTTSVWDQKDTEDDTALLEEVNDELYLGETISSDSKPDKNIKKRVARGISASNSIIEILNGTIFGNYECEVFLVLRSSLMLSSLISNSESWNNILPKHIQELEMTDEKLLRRKFELHSKSSKTWLYLEFGILPVKYLIMRRRLNYLHYLLIQSEQSMLYQSLQAMIKSSVRGDWIELVNKDLHELDISLSFEEIKRTSPNEFKNFVNKQTEEKAFNYLMNIKETQSKIRNITYKKLQMAEYLKSHSKQTKTEVNFILTLRSRTLNITANFQSSKEPNKPCKACVLGFEIQEHFFSCVGLNNNCLSTESLNSIKYDDLFSEDADKIIRV